MLRLQRSRKSTPTKWRMKVVWHTQHPAHPQFLLCLLKAIGSSNGNFMQVFSPLNTAPLCHRLAGDSAFTLLVKFETCCPDCCDLGPDLEHLLWYLTPLVSVDLKVLFTQPQLTPLYFLLWSPSVVYRMAYMCTPLLVCMHVMCKQCLYVHGVQTLLICMHVQTLLVCMYVQHWLSICMSLQTLLVCMHVQTLLVWLSVCMYIWTLLVCMHFSTKSTCLYACTNTACLYRCDITACLHMYTTPCLYMCMPLLVCTHTTPLYVCTSLLVCMCVHHCFWILCRQNAFQVGALNWLYVAASPVLVAPAPPTELPLHSLQATTVWTVALVTNLVDHSWFAWPPPPPLPTMG